MANSKFRRLVVSVLLAAAPFQSIELKAQQSNDMSTESSVPPRGSASSGLGLELLTDSEGVNFNEYLRGVYLSLKKSWFAMMPPSVSLGNQGINTVEFRILEDGSAPQDFVKMVRKSDKSDLDAASLHAVRNAGSFGHLPEKFSGPFIVVRFTFYYNLPVPKDSESKQ